MTEMIELAEGCCNYYRYAPYVQQGRQKCEYAEEKSGGYKNDLIKHVEMNLQPEFRQNNCHLKQKHHLQNIKGCRIYII